MKAIAEALGVSRSNLIERSKRPRKSYRKTDDRELVPRTRDLVDIRPTYGYRRITALLNRQLRAESKPPINHKRVFRVMKQNSLLLQRHTGRRTGRSHDGIVMTERSNQRWCSDAFEIGCLSGDVVRVVFAIDTCDREIIAWTATTAGISGEMVRDLMLECIERRFNRLTAPHRIEWLTDNGSGYTAYDTIEFATTLGLSPCFTPVRSPESNGMAEAFVKTFKRDYVRCNLRLDAASVLAELPTWFSDYNDSHPHRGLKMLSPREYIKAHSSLAPCPV